MASRIVLTAINARYSHSAHGIRCLYANMGELKDDTSLLEFDLHAAPELIARQILDRRPDIAGFSVYIWNTPLVEAVLRAVRNESGRRMAIVCGGPEAGYLPDVHPLVQLCDYRVRGEGESVFPELCRNLLSGMAPGEKHITASPPDLAEMVLPYETYSDEDLAHRMLYVEASRGCPFQCDYCLSSLDGGVRFFPLERLLPAFQRLIDRGARNFKFLDRCFNIRDDHALAILSFFQKHLAPGMSLHLELIPDRLSSPLRAALCAFPSGVLHVEAGIQTYDPSVAERIHRRCHTETADANIRFLVRNAGATVHADLIAGLPGESLQQFAKGFDRLYHAGAQEIQVGILKRLHGTPIDRHREEWSMVYNPDPPYEVISTSALSGAEVVQIQHYADYWESLHNRRQFPESMALIAGTQASIFNAFMKLSGYLFERFEKTHAIPMLEMMRALFDYLTREEALHPSRVAQALLNDYLQGGRRSKPPRYLMEQADSAQE